MQIMIEIDEARFKDIQRIAEVQLEMNHFQTAEQIIANGVPIEQEQKTEKVIKMRDATPEERESIGKYIKSISKLTGVDFWDLYQEPKTGRWIDDKCSECGKGIEDLIASPEWYRDEEPKFCPFCGIKLVDEQERSDEE